MNRNVLIVDIGNTASDFAVFNNKNLQDFLGFFKLPNEKNLLKEKVTSFRKNGLKIDDGMIFSVVPSINELVINIVEEVFGIKLKVFDWHSYNLKKKNPKIKEAIGADLLADIKQADIEYGGPCLVADFGTVTKLMQLDKNGSFEGLSFIPGIEISLKLFNTQTELLPQSEDLIAPKDRLGLTTIESMHHGVYYSTIYYVKEVLITLDKDTKLILTGGNVRFIKDEFADAIIDRDLTLKGMYSLYKEISK